MTPHEHVVEEAKQLKEEGNVLYVQKDYVLASAKYTEAIKLDDNNAVLYANRAACRLALGQFLDACMDATKATELDPLYSKAYARVATAHDALNNILLSLDAWQRALETLPKGNLTPKESKQKEQYEGGLKAARDAYHKAQHPENAEPLQARLLNGSKHQSSIGADIFCRNPHQGMPWEIANDAVSFLAERREVNSSVWVIVGAYKEFSAGVDVMKDLDERTQSRVACFLRVLLYLSTGILRDPRVLFHDSSRTAMYKVKAQLETMPYNAWNGTDPERIIEEAQTRQPTEGWAKVRDALAITVCGWIICGVIDGKLDGKYESAVENLGRAIRVIKRGRMDWEDVPRENRGSIFEEPFLFGLQSVYMDAYRMAYLKDPLNSKYSLEDLYEEAKQLSLVIEDRLQNTEMCIDAGFVQSFFIYPRAHAIAIQGFYHAQIAKMCTSDRKAKENHDVQAMRMYLEAATAYPQDDELHAWYTACTLNHMWANGSYIRDQLEILQRLQSCMPKMQQMWANSAMAKGRDEAFNSMLNKGREFLELIAKKQFKLSDYILTMPISLQDSPIP